MRARGWVVGVVVVTTTAACGAFGSSEGSSGSGTSSTPAQARSIKCEGSTCTGSDACCVDQTTTCKADCTGLATIFCDDTADCASQGLVCCVNIVVADATTAGLKGTTCQSTASCQAPSNLRVCDPARTDNECGPGKGCVKLTQLYPKVYPSFPVYVCE